MGCCLYREAKHGWATPLHFSSTGTSQLPLADRGCRKGQQPHAEVFGSQWLPAWHSPSPASARSHQHGLGVGWCWCPRLARPARSRFTHSLAQHLNWVELNTCLCVFGEQQAGQVTARTGRAGLKFFDVANSPQFQLRGTETSGKFGWTK